MKSYILDLHNKLINNEIKVIDLVNESINNINKYKHTNSYINETFNEAKQIADDIQKDLNKNQTNLLFGIPYALKDNVCTKNTITTGGSLFLKDFVPQYDATITQILNNANSIMMCKSNLDEFGLGGTGTHSAYGVVKSVLDEERIIGGSSSGSTNLVAGGCVPFAIGSDTGDSVRRPPSFAGIVGFKPTYGAISRYGVMPYAPSLDCVGVCAKTVADIAIVCEHLIKFDPKDFSSQKFSDTNFFKNLKTLKNIKIGFIKGFEQYLESSTKESYLKAIKILEENNCQIIYLDFPESLLKSIHTIYYAISYSEAASCWSNLSGIPFGGNLGGNNFEEIMLNSRSKLLGRQIKRRFTIGQYITKHENFEKYFLRSQKIRHYLVNEWEKLLNQVDVVICPGASSTAPKIKDAQTHKYKTTLADDFLCISNFAGNPSLTIKYTKINGLPFGLNLNCKKFEEQKLLNIGLTLEEIFEKVHHE